jgi:hypothetical protein
MTPQELVKKMYSEQPIEIVQKRAATMYFFMLQKGYEKTRAVSEILEHGVEYNDLMAGILTKEMDA